MKRFQRTTVVKPVVVKVGLVALALIADSHSSQSRPSLLPHY